MADVQKEFADALPTGPVRGRGAGLNPGNRFETVRLHVLGEHLDELASESPHGARIATHVLDDATRTVLNHVDSPDLAMSWTLNPYRGCEHGCIYCYARPGHEYLGMSCGVDFETRILAKHDAPSLLRKALAHPKWTPETIVMSGVTDPYQPVERDLNITRGCLAVLAECRHPVSIITKNALVLRDLDILTALNADRLIHVAVSITTLDNTLASKMEPRASAPAARLDAVRRLAAAGIPVTVMTAPIIPGLNDREIPHLLSAAADAGATGAGMVLLRLPYQIKALFCDWLARNFPDRAAHIESLIRQTRGGELYEAAFGSRMRGEGPIAEQIGQTFRVFARKHGLDRPRTEQPKDRFVRPLLPGGQMGLFG